MITKKKSIKFVILSVAVIFMAVSMSIFASSYDERSSDAITTDKLLIDEGEAYSGDVSITDYMIVEGTYSGQVSLISGSTIYSEISFTNISGFELYVNSGSPYITGQISSGDSQGTFTMVSGDLVLGKDANGFTGIVTGGTGSLECNDIVGTQVTISDSSMSVSGETDSSLGIGFSTIGSCTIEASNEYTGDEEVTITGAISNDLLDNNFKVVKKDSDTYQLIGTLGYIDRNGGSSLGTFFDLLVGDKNDCTHAVMIGTSGDVVVSDNVIALGNGQYIVCLSSGVYSLDIGGYTVSFSGLIMGSEGQIITPGVSGIESKMTVSGNVEIGDLTICPSIALTTGSDADLTFSSDADFKIDGSLYVIGTLDLTKASSSVISGTIISEGYTITDGDSDINIQYSAYYISNDQRIYTTFSKAIAGQSDGEIHVSRSLVIDSSTKISSDMQIINQGTLYIDGTSDFINEGNVLNNASCGIIISDNSNFNNTNGKMTNDGFITAYGLFTNKGSFGSKVYADVSYYNNTTTRFGSLPVMLNEVSAGDSISLRRNVTLLEDSTLPAGVTLSTNSWTFTIQEGIKFNVDGTLDVISQTNVDGTLDVIGTVKVRSGSVLSVEGTMIVSGTAYVSGTLEVDDLIVTGVMTVTGIAIVYDQIQVGNAPTDLPYANSTCISGEVSLDEGAIAIVYGDVSEFNPKTVFGYTESTQFLFDGDTYAFEYSSSDSTKLILLVPKITDVGFAQWLDPSGKSITGVHYVGDYEYVNADTTTETFTVVLTNNPGIVWVFDGITPYEGGATIMVPYGEHYIELRVVDGYHGTPVLYLGNDVISQGQDFMVIQDCTFTVTGVTYGGGGGSSDNGVTMILVAIIIVAVVLILAMLYLLIRKKKRNDIQ